MNTISTITFSFAGKIVVAEEMKPVATHNWLIDLHDGADYV
jgi:hypothetical protein